MTLGRRGLLFGQGVYYLGTGIWPIVDLSSFLRVTGPKTDIWLLRTLSLLICAVGAVLTLAGLRGRSSADARRLSGASALALLAADVYYVAKGTISPVYLLDAATEAPFVAAWLLPGRRQAAEATGRTPPA
jgi:hypothetical protein